MFRIAICSDDKKIFDEISKYVRNYAAQESDREIEAVSFDSGRRLIGALEDCAFFDVFLIDACIGDESEIELIKDIRRRGIESPVIFLASSADDAPECIEIGVFRYLLKPILPDKFYEAVGAAIAQAERMEEKFVKLKTGNGVARVAIHHIVCSEACGHYQHITLKDGTKIRVRMTVTEMFGLLSEYGGFIRVGAAYVVNLRHVKHVSHTEVCLCDDTTVQIPRGKYNDIRNDFLDFYPDF